MTGVVDSMCFTPAEKEELFHRLAGTERKTDQHETTIRVAFTVASIFVGVITMIAIWYLRTRDNDIEAITVELQRINGTLVRMETQIEFYQASLNGHVSDPRKHPDNTDRVNRLIDDVRDLRQEVNQIQ